MTLASRLRALTRLGGEGARVPERKSTGGSLVFGGGSAEAAAWSERSYAALARAGFQQNPVVYRCVRLIAETASAVPILLFTSDLHRAPWLSKREKELVLARTVAERGEAAADPLTLAKAGKYL